MILGLGRFLEEEIGIHSSILVWRIPWTEKAGYSPWGCKESDTTEATEHTIWLVNYNREGGSESVQIVNMCIFSI